MIYYVIISLSWKITCTYRQKNAALYPMRRNSKRKGNICTYHRYSKRQKYCSRIYSLTSFDYLTCLHASLQFLCPNILSMMWIIYRKICHYGLTIETSPPPSYCQRNPLFYKDYCALSQKKVFYTQAII